MPQNEPSGTSRNGEKIQREIVETVKPNKRVVLEAIEESANGESRKYFRISQMKKERYKPLGGGAPKETRLKEEIATVPAGRGYDIMTALAEMYGCEVTER